MTTEGEAGVMAKEKRTNIGNGFVLLETPGVRGPEDMAYAAIVYRASTYESHGWGYGATPADAERVARSRWDEFGGLS